MPRLREMPATTGGDDLTAKPSDLGEELEELQDAIFDLAEGEDDDGGPVPERCGGGRRYCPAMTLDEGEPLSSSVMTGGDGPPVTSP